MQIEKAGSLAQPSRFTRLTYGDFVWVTLGSLVLLALIAAGEHFPFFAPLRLLLGFVYVLYVPGYCLTTALFPGIDDLGSVERAGLSLGLSIAVVPLLALVLDRLPWGLHPLPVVLGEFGTGFLFMLIAVWRRSVSLPAQAYSPRLDWKPKVWWCDLTPSERRIFALVTGAMVLAALASAWGFLVASPDQFMTEFYILGDEKLAEGYPRQAFAGQDLQVTLGIVNRERSSHTYRVEAWAVDTWADTRRELAARAGPFNLEPGEGLVQSLIWKMPWTGKDQQVEFLLLIDDDAGPYRQLRLWLDVSAKNGT